MANQPPPIPHAAEPQVAKAPTLSKAPPAGKLFPCANCGAKVEFDPRSRSLKCPFCGHETAISAAPDSEGKIVEHDFDAYVNKLEDKASGEIAGRSSQVKCTGCGAIVLLEDKVVTEKCPFCSTHLENKPETVKGMLPPESIIPFEVDLRAARQAFDAWIKGLWFAPTPLKKLADLGQLTGIYIPYWTYDAMTYTHYSGLRGDDYTETETYTEKDAQGNDETKTRTVVKTLWTPVSGEVQHFFDDVLVCGSKSLPEHLVEGLEPWELKQLEAFKSDYLAGLKTERYALGLKDGLVVAKQRMEPAIVSLVNQDIGGNHQQILSKSTQYLGITFKHCLLPLWVANYRYQDTVYHILVNGLTGKVSGERPWSVWKILRLIAVILLVVGLIIGIVKMAQGSSGRPAQPAPHPVQQHKVGLLGPNSPSPNLAFAAHLGECPSAPVTARAAPAAMNHPLAV